MDSEVKIRKVSDIAKTQLINQNKDPLSDLRRRINVVIMNFMRWI